MGDTTLPMQLKVVSLKQAQYRIEEVIEQRQLPKEQGALMRIMAGSVPSFQLRTGVFLRLMDLTNFVTNFIRAYEAKDSSLLIQQRGLKVDRVADIEEFINSAEFMRQGGSVRPAIMRKLIDFFENDGFVEGVLCLSKDMRVPMLDGTKPTIKELAETKKPNEKFWVYTRGKDGLRPAQARFPHKTGVDVLWRVNFIDGSSARGNARHQFLTISGEKVQIQNLKVGDRIDSMYLGERRFHRNHVVESIECLGYEEDVYCLTVDSTGTFFVEVEGGDADGSCILSSNTGAI